MSREMATIDLTIGQQSEMKMTIPAVDLPGFHLIIVILQKHNKV